MTLWWSSIRRKNCIAVFARRVASRKCILLLVPCLMVYLVAATWYIRYFELLLAKRECTMLLDV